MSPHERLRFGVREDVIFNPRLSAGAARLYLALDSMAGFKGQCWPNQVVLAKRLGTTDRALRRWLAELASLVSMVHRRGANVYLLSWAEQERKPIAQGRTLASDLRAPLTSVDRTKEPVDVGRQCPTYNQEIESRNKSKRQARELIEQYPFAKDLRGSPDESLVQACFDLAGDITRLGDALRAMWKAGKRPTISWAWFRTVLPSYLEREERRA